MTLLRLLAGSALVLAACLALGAFALSRVPAVRARFAMVDGEAPCAWADFAAPGCHPSRAGYGMIAAHVAHAIEAE